MASERILSLKELRDDRRTFKEVCDKLNIKDYWKYLHEKLKEKIPSLKEEAAEYEKHNHGGGSAALSWLKAVTIEKVKIPEKDELFEITLKHFIATACKLERGDIVLHLKRCKKVKFLKDLSQEELKKLSQDLDEDVQGMIHCWKDFASHYGYDHERRMLFERQKQIPNSYDPTHILLTDVLTINEDFTLKEFVKCLQDIGRNDVVNIVKKFENEKQQERETSEKNKVMKPKVEEQHNKPKGKAKKGRRGRKKKKTIVGPDSEISDCGGEHPEQPQQADGPLIMVQAAESDFNGKDNVTTVLSNGNNPLCILQKAPVNLSPEDLPQTLPPSNDQTPYLVNDYYHHGRNNVATVLNNRNHPLCTLQKAPANPNPEDLKKTLPPNNDETPYAVNDYHHQNCDSYNQDTSDNSFSNNFKKLYGFIVFFVIVAIGILFSR